MEDKKKKKQGMSVLDAVNNVATFIAPETTKAIKEIIKDPRKLTTYIRPPGIGVEDVLNPQGAIDRTKQQARVGLETGSFAVPAAKTLKAAPALGAVAGTMYGAAQEGATPESVASSGIAGGIAGAGAKIVGNAFKGVSNYLSKMGANRVAKSTPGSASKLIEEHGFDPRNLVKEFVPPGASYDDLLGDVTQRNQGGIIAQRMRDAEKIIQDKIASEKGQTSSILDLKGNPIKVAKKVIDTGEDFINPLLAKRAELAKTVGNAAKIEQLDGLIKETEQLFRNGADAETLLMLKRAADSTFGKAVVEDEKGAIVNQVQKELGNKARAILKAKFPDIAKALDDESKLFSTRELLSKARGAEIADKGALSKVDLTRPGTLVDPLLNKPEVASTISNAGQVGLNIDNAVGNAAQVGARQLGAITGSVLGFQENPNNQTDQSQNQPEMPVGEDNTHLPDTTTTEAKNQEEKVYTIKNAQTGETKQVKASELGNYGITQQPQASAQAQGASETDRLEKAMAWDLQYNNGKNLSKIKTMYDVAKSKEDAKKPEKKSVTQQAREELGYGVDTALQMLDDPNAKPRIGVLGIGSKIEEAKGAFNVGDPATLAFNKVLSELQASIAKARGGTSFTPNEQKLLDQYSPKLGDSEQQIRTKLIQLKKKIDYFKNNQVVDSPLQFSSGQPAVAQ